MRGALVLAFGAGVLLHCTAARPPAPNEATPGLVFPAHFAEGEEQDAGAKPQEPLLTEPAKRTNSPPDPEPLRQAEQYEYTFTYEEGNVTVLGVRAQKFREPVVTARKMGRFAVELWVGTELVDRVRFDFPLLAAEAPPPKKRRPLNDPPSMAGGVLKATVLVPASWRARRAVLLDRATNVEKELAWPPPLGSAQAADAGLPVADAGAPTTHAGVAAEPKRTP